MQFSKFQQDIFDHIQNNTNSLVISALAGSGKTTTIIESLKLLPKDRNVLMLAFNKSIADELKTKVPKHVDVRTFNSLGASAIYSKIGNTTLDNNKTSRIALEANGGYKTAAMFKAIPLANHAKTFGICPTSVKGKSFLPDTIETWEYLIDHFSLDLGSCDPLQVINLARNILVDSIAEVSKKKTIDFADQIYIPVIKNLPMMKYDYVFVDEMQDVSKIQISMIHKSLTPKGKLIAIGDRNQAIYGFRGASTEAFDAIIDLFKCDVLPLSVSYRCAKSIVQEANKIVKDMLPRDNAPDGKISSLSSWDHSDIKPNSMVLCRNNAPLIDLMYYLMKNNIPAKLNNNDNGKPLLSLITELKAKTIPTLLSKLNDWEISMTNKLIKKNMAFMIDSILDKSSCLKTIIKNTNPSTIEHLNKTIQNLFDSTIPDKNAVLLSSCHRSKGLESNTVYFLDPHLLPSKHAKKPWEFEQESNLKYVAITRAKNELFFINSNDKANDFSGSFR